MTAAGGGPPRPAPLLPPLLLLLSVGWCPSGAAGLGSAGDGRGALIHVAPEPQAPGIWGAPWQQAVDPDPQVPVDEAWGAPRQGRAVPDPQVPRDAAWGAPWQGRAVPDPQVQVQVDEAWGAPFQGRAVPDFNAPWPAPAAPKPPWPGFGQWPSKGGGDSAARQEPGSGQGAGPTTAVGQLQSFVARLRGQRAYEARRAAALASLGEQLDGQARDQRAQLGAPFEYGAEIMSDLQGKVKELSGKMEAKKEELGETLEPLKAEAQRLMEEIQLANSTGTGNITELSARIDRTTRETNALKRDIAQLDAQDAALDRKWGQFEARFNKSSNLLEPLKMQAAEIMAEQEKLARVNSDLQRQYLDLVAHQEDEDMQRQADKARSFQERMEDLLKD